MTSLQKSESPLAGGQIANQNTESTASVPLVDDSINIIDRLEIAGFAVHRLDSDGFIVVRWGGLSKHLPDVHALAGFAQQVGA